MRRVTERPLRRLALIALAAAATLVAAPASACVWNPVIYVGVKPPSARTVYRRERADKLAEVRENLRTGKVDPAVELADMLIPNVRPVLIRDVSDCGGVTEFDRLGGLDRETTDLFAGTELEGSDPERYSSFYIPQLREYGRPCNAEFRAGFAALLRTRLRPALLGQAYVALAFERGWSGHERYYRFSGDRRQPPVTLDVDPGPWRRLKAWLAPGKPLSVAVADFWAANPVVRGSDVICPNADRAFVAARDAELARWRARPDYPRRLREAELGRARRSKPPEKTQ